jgi:predicted acylesterase/phospholipase RssA
MAPVKVQIAFQGGGARLACLMAAAEVLKEFETDGKVEITAITGVSAGAIAACMLASKETPIADFKVGAIRALNAHSALLTGFSWLRSLRVVFGWPYFPESFLTKLFGDLFGTRTKVRELADNRVLRLYATDLTLNEQREIDSNETVARALAWSCAVPFVFSGARSQGFVDGGLVNNLPVDDLCKQRGPTYGDVLAIGFESENSPAPDGFARNLKYALNLFSAAISAGVSRSSRLLPDDGTHKIKTKIGMFDFALAGNFIGSDDWREIKDRFQDHLEGWIDVRATNDPNTTWVSPAVLGGHPFVDFGAFYQTAIVEAAHGASELIHIKKRVDIDRELSDEEKRSTGPEFELVVHLEFIPQIPQPLLTLQIQIGADKVVRGLSVRMQQGDKNVVSYRAIAESALLSNRPSFRLWIEFPQKLELNPTSPYLLTIRYKAGDVFPDIEKGKAEYSVIRSSLGPTDEGIVLALISKKRLGFGWEWKDITVSERKHDITYKHNLVQSEQALEEHYSQYLGLLTNTKELAVFASRATNLKQLDAYGFAIEKK